MRRYYISLVVVTLVLALVSFVVMWTAPGRFLTVMPLLALYFAAVTGVQHYFVVKSMYQSPKRFVQFFLAATVAALFLHLIVFAAYLFTHTQQAKLFAIAFCIGFAVMLAFETVALILLIRRERNRQQHPEN